MGGLPDGQTQLMQLQRYFDFISFAGDECFPTKDIDNAASAGIMREELKGLKTLAVSKTVANKNCIENALPSSVHQIDSMRHALPSILPASAEKCATLFESYKNIVLQYSPPHVPRKKRKWYDKNGTKM